MSMIERVTFGRSVSFVAEVAVVSIPLIFAAASGSPPQYFVSLSTQSLLILALFGLIGSSTFAYLILQKVGQSTYSPNLQSKPYILSSTILLLIFGIVATYIGYLLLVYPYSKLVIPKTNDVLVGLFLSSLYLIALSSAVAIAVWSQGQKQEKEELVSKFLGKTSELKEADLDDIDELADTIESTGYRIADETKREPMEDADELCQKFRQWLNDFEGASGSDKKRMVGWTVNNTDQRDEPWHGYYSTLVELRKELSKLDSSSQGKEQYDA